jgi:WhiB family transcriptional regulator, redox-sensing transcriptional regulator
MTGFAWREHAACVDLADPELFFPDGEADPARYQAAQAAAVCRTCPIADWYLQWARENGMEHGVWGGVDLDKRRNRRRPRRQAAKCGTRGGYRAHRRLKTPVCEDCRAANTAYVNDYLQRTKEAA